MALISVIVPAYNAVKYLESCLDSIASQTFEDFEAIIVDDGSTDSTPAIADAFGRLDERFTLIRQDNGGVSKARNAGIDSARGKYITFVDADDALHPEALGAMYGALKEREAQVCICAFARFRSDWRSGEVRVPRHPGKAEEYDYPSAMEKALYQKRILNSPWGMMMEKRLLMPDIRFREGTRYEDLDAFYRFYENASRIVYLPYPYYFYREHSGSFIHTWSPERLDVLDVTDRMEEFFKRRYPSLERAAQDRRFSAHFNMLLLMLKNGTGSEQERRRCLDIIKGCRRRELADPKVRFKNKMGALLSYFGEGALKIAAKIYSVK